MQYSFYSLQLYVLWNVPSFSKGNRSTETSDAIEICYTSRLIEPGDSLWSIAEETITDSYGSVSEYVEALKVMNHLDSDTIHAGQYLMITYEKL